MKIKVTKTGPRHGSVAWVKKQEEIHGGLECILWAAPPYGAFVTVRLKDNKHELLQVPLEEDAGKPADYDMDHLRRVSGQHCEYLGVPAVAYLMGRVDWDHVEQEYEADDTLHTVTEESQ